jgi:hypothetical protein
MIIQFVLELSMRVRLLLVIALAILLSMKMMMTKASIPRLTGLKMIMGFLQPGFAQPKMLVIGV